MARTEDHDTSMITAAIRTDFPSASSMQGRPGNDSAAAAATRIRAVSLRLAGLSYDQIAEQAGYSDRSTARHAVMRALDRAEEANVGELRTVENHRLDRAQAAIWPAVLRGDTKAVDTFLRLSARRSRLNGLDAPQVLEVSSPARVALEDALGQLREVVLGQVIEEGDGDDDEPGPDALTTGGG